MLTPKTILQNRYSVVRELGHGGMGTVYEAIDQRINCIVALKETIAGDNEEARRAFEREASLLGNLRHPALPKVMDYFSEAGGDFLVMEFIRGYDLAELLDLRGHAFPQAQVLRWADEVLKVLEYLHSQKPPILHRDLKPSNLKLTKQGEIFVLDFGLAKGSLGQMPTLATSRSVRGYTLAYASLEQIHGHGTDARSDLYSLGATLYHLLTGLPPLDAPARYHAVEDDQPDPLAQIQMLNPEVSAGVAAIIHQSMAVSRKYRLVSATEMRKALRNALEEDERHSAEEEYLRAEAARRQRAAERERAAKEAAVLAAEARELQEAAIRVREADEQRAQAEAAAIARRQAEELAARRAAEHEAANRRAAEERAQAEAAAIARQQAEELAARRQIEEQQAARRAAEEEAADRRSAQAQAQAEAAAIARQQAEELAARQAAEEEAANRRAADERAQAEAAAIARQQSEARARTVEIGRAQEVARTEEVARTAGPEQGEREVLVSASVTAPSEQSGQVRLYRHQFKGPVPQATKTIPDPPPLQPLRSNHSDGAVTSDQSLPASHLSSKRVLIISAGVLALILIGSLLVWALRRTAAPDSSGASQVQPGSSPQATPAPASVAGKELPPPVITAPSGMVYVPGGTFMMGSNDGDEAERPAHQVIVKQFFIDAYEVTNEDYERFVKDTKHRTPATWKDATFPAGAARKPVTGATWADANDYARWTGKRLPTEEEWEFAARGADGRRYPWGNDWRQGSANANGAEQAMADVGAYKGTSPFGVYDMIGNAWEWTASAFRAYPGGRLPPKQPSGELRAIRGGSYESTKDYGTTTYRVGWPATYASASSQTGFRCVKNVEKQ